MNKTVVGSVLLLLVGCGPIASELDATCERHAEFTDSDGYTHVMHTCSDGIYYDGELYAPLEPATSKPSGIGNPSKIWHKKVA